MFICDLTQHGNNKMFCTLLEKVRGQKLIEIPWHQRRNLWYLILSEEECKLIYFLVCFILLIHNFSLFSRAPTISIIFELVYVAKYLFFIYYFDSILQIIKMKETENFGMISVWNINSTGFVVLVPRVVRVNQFKNPKNSPFMYKFLKNAN